MPRLELRTCKECGRSRDEVGPLSWTRLCGECGPRLHAQANDELHYHRGPTFVKWRRGMAGSVGGVLLDDLQPTE